MHHEQHDVNKRAGSAMRNLPACSDADARNLELTSRFPFTTVLAGTSWHVRSKSSTGGSPLTRYQQPVALACRVTSALNTERVVTIPDCIFSWIYIQMDHV